MERRIVLALSLVASTFCFNSVLYGATEADYEAERNKSNALASYLNVDEAYELGYTGYGITVAVYGTQIKQDHPELEGKVTSLTSYNESYNYSGNGGNNSHETWVAGIIAAAKDGVGMHGLAYNSNILNLRNGYSDATLATQYSYVRIFNYSYSNATSIKIPSIISSFSKYGDYTNNVYVFSAGNSYANTPSYEAQTPAYYGTGQYANIISVGALASATASYDENGNLVLSNVSAASYSNLPGTIAALWTIFVPSGVYAPDARTDGYSYEYGTSFSAPIVSGALALVLEAYPWLTGKQLADAVLTTATTDFTYNASGNRANLTQEQIFGRGILNVGAAVQGIALLDSDRMTSENAQDVSELGNDKQALEIFDTQGYSGEFANDIASSAWEDKYHTKENTELAKADKEALQSIGLIGLLKTGAGTLTLSGDNTYTGATVIEGGVLNVSKRTKTTSAGEAGSGGIVRGAGVVVREGGILTGNGSIYTQVVNNGTLISSYLNGGGLSVQSISGTGTYYIEILDGVDIASSGALIIDSSLGAGEEVSNVASISYSSTESSATSTASTAASTASVNSSVVASSALLAAASSVSTDSASSTSSATVTSSTSSATNSLNGTLVVSYSIQDLSGTFIANNTTYTTKTPFLSVAEGDSVDINFDTVVVNVDSPSLTATSTATTSDDINSDYTLEFTLSHESDAYSQYASNDDEAALGEQIVALSALANSGDTMAGLLTALDWSNPDGSEITSALGQIYNSTEIFYVNSYLSLKQQSDFNTILLSQRLLSREMATSAFWITPFGAYNMRRGNLSEFDSWSAGAIGGIDGHIGDNSLLGIHIAAGNTSTRMNIGDESNILGFYAGIHAKFQITKALYALLQSRVGVESADAERVLLVDNAYYNNDTNFTNLILGEMLGFGVDFGLSNVFDMGILAFGEYAYLTRLGMKEENTTQVALLLSDKDTYQSLNGVAGLKAGFSWGGHNALDFYVLYKHEFLNTNISDMMYFSGFKSYGVGVNSTLKDRDSLLVQMYLTILGDKNGYVNLGLGGEMSKSSLVFNGSLQLGSTF